MLRARICFALVGTLLLGCNDHECAQDSDCSVGKICVESGGVLFSGRSCVQLTVGVDMSVADLPVDMTVDIEPPCVGEVDRVLCEASLATCGEIVVFDRCGTSRSVACGLCQSYEICTDDKTCVCVPEGDAEFCSNRGKSCGLFEAEDRCGSNRQVDCGSCEGVEECGEQSPNVCGCPCQIGDQCYPVGTPNPGNPCQSCQPTLDAMGWSNRISPCDDGDLCTVNDSCQDGVCVGNQVECTREMQCNVSVCSPDNGLCEYVPSDDGGTCNDGNLCTIEDTCKTGSCLGLPKRCLATEQCQTSSCSMSTGACVTGNAPNGTACNDGNSCTSNDACQNGACVGQQVKMCAEL